MIDVAVQPLTPRQFEVLTMVALGDSNADIARRLGISLDTAKQHVLDVIVRLNAVNRTHAVTQAFRAGVLS